MLQPKKRKYRKSFRGRMKGVSQRGNKLSFGEFGIKAMGRAWVSSAQLESARRVITNTLKRKGRVWVKVFPDKPVSARPAGQRMGGGKGDIDRYVVTVKPGRVLFEVAGVGKAEAQKALRKAGDKLPFKTRIIVKEE